MRSFLFFIERDDLVEKTFITTPRDLFGKKVGSVGKKLVHSSQDVGSIITADVSTSLWG